MIHAYYTDGTEAIFNTLEECQKEVEETIVGCNFATGVEQICDDNGRQYVCTWSLSVAVDPQ